MPMHEASAWPGGDGEMARRIREHDWAETPLGRIDRWPQSLRTVVDLILAMPGPATILWGPENIQLYNDAYRTVARDRHPGLLARPVEQGWADAYEEVIRPLIDKARAGRSTHMADFRVELQGADGTVEDRYFDSDWSPIRGQTGEVEGSLQTIVEVTERKRTETALAQSEVRQAFMLKLSDVLRPLSDPVDIQKTAARMTAEHLDIGRVAYCEIRYEPGIVVIVERDWPRRGMPSVAAGRYRMDDFGRFLAEEMTGGRIVTVADAETDPRLTAADRENWAAFDILANCSIPVVKGGRFVAYLVAQDNRPHDWAGREVELLREVSERTWSAVERARAESALIESERRQSAMLEVLPVGLGLVDTSGNVVLSNPEWARFVPDRMVPSRNADRGSRWRSWDGEGKLIEPMQYPAARALRGEHVDPAMEFLYTDDDGRKMWTSVAAVPLTNGNGKVTGAVCIIHDIDAVKRAGDTLRESDERFREFSDASSDVIWMRDAESLCWTYLSRGFEPIYGVSREDALKNDNLRNWAELILPEDRQHALDNIRRVRRGERRAFEYRIRRPADGDMRWLRNTDFPIRDENGKVVRIGGIGSDITSLKHAQEHQRLLLAELQHRVRNTLAIVRSIARRTAENSTTAEDMLAHFQGRLDAFSRVQAVLTRGVGAKVDLASLIDDELIAHAARDGEQIHVEGPEISLAPKTAERLSLAIHELATNAVKHGALSKGRGRIAIRWRTEPDGGGNRLVLSWKESGVELDGAPRREGFGTELLLRSLPYDVQGETRMDFPPHGLEFELSMPLPPANGTS